MPDITPVLRQGAQLIDGYHDTGFRIQGRQWHGAIVVQAQQTMPSPVTALHSPIQQADIAPLLPIVQANASEILLIGSGARGMSVTRDARDAFRAVGIIIEVMDSGAACRVFNVLLAEDRRITALLLPQQPMDGHLSG